MYLLCNIALIYQNPKSFYSQGLRLGDGLVLLALEVEVAFDDRTPLLNGRDGAEFGPFFLLRCHSGMGLKEYAKSNKQANIQFNPRS